MQRAEKRTINKYKKNSSILIELNKFFYSSNNNFFPLKLLLFKTHVYNFRKIEFKPVSIIANRMHESYNKSFDWSNRAHYFIKIPQKNAKSSSASNVMLDRASLLANQLIGQVMNWLNHFQNSAWKKKNDKKSYGFKDGIQHLSSLASWWARTHRKVYQFRCDFVVRKKINYFFMAQMERTKWKTKTANKLIFQWKILWRSISIMIRM